MQVPFKKDLAAELRRPISKKGPTSELPGGKFAPLPPVSYATGDLPFW